MTIKKRISKKGVVSYLIKVSLGYDYNGKQIVKSKTYKPQTNMTQVQIEREVKKQAELFEEESRNKYLLGIDSANNNPTFKELAEEFLSLIETTQEQKTSSIERLKNCKERVYLAIGKYEIADIKFRQIQQFILSLSRAGANKVTGKGLSQKTQKHHLTFISDVMNYAIKCGLTTENPCKNISTVKTEKKEKQVYSLEEMKQLLKKIDETNSTNYMLFFRLASFLGLRRAEILGLEWKDVDFKDNTLSIVRTSNYNNKSTGVYTSTPKTQTSYRVLSIPEPLIPHFKRLKEEQKKQKVACGDQWIKTDRLFTSWNGRPMHPNTPYNWLGRLCEREKIKFYGIHSFRHSFATTAITNGTDVSTVSSVLGHSQTSTTLNIYTHAVKKANIKAVKVVADLIAE